MKSKDKLARRREAIPWTGPEKWVQRGFIASVAALALLVVWISYVEESERKVLPAGSDIRLPLADLKPGRLRLVGYEIDSSTATQVAIQRGQDGILRVAFGSCRNCRRFSHYKWFGKLICSRCNHVILLPNPDEQPAAKRGCSSVAIPYAVEGDHLFVRGSTITAVFREWYQPAKDKK